MFRELLYLLGWRGTPVAGTRGRITPHAASAIRLGREVRAATLFTELEVNGNRVSFEAAGVRGCGTVDTVFQREQGTAVYNLTCDLTYFAADNTPVGPVRIIQDPRIVTRGFIFLRRNRRGDFALPALSYFNQHLIFHVGDRFFYYPRAWQVVSSITAWPPENHQYHHLEPDTPIFDFISGEPNVARKGISTISIGGPLTPDRERHFRDAYRREAELVSSLPASKMAPLPLTPAQGGDITRLG